MKKLIYLCAGLGLAMNFGCSGTTDKNETKSETVTTTPNTTVTTKTTQDVTVRKDTTSNNDWQKKDWQLDKSDVKARLTHLRDNFDNKIKRMDERIDNASGDTKKNLKDERSHMKDDRKIIDKDIDKVTASSENDWHEVRAQANTDANNLEVKWK